jgi:hypothetical protein
MQNYLYADAFLRTWEFVTNKENEFSQLTKSLINSQYDIRIPSTYLGGEFNDLLTLDVAWVSKIMLIDHVNKYAVVKFKRLNNKKDHYYTFLDYSKWFAHSEMKNRPPFEGEKIYFKYKDSLQTPYTQLFPCAIRVESSEYSHNLLLEGYRKGLFGKRFDFIKTENMHKTLVWIMNSRNELTEKYKLDGLKEQRSSLKFIAPNYIQWVNVGFLD